MSKIRSRENNWNKLKDILTDWLIVGHGEEITVLNRILDIMSELEQNEKEKRNKRK